jgi:hypothetical protein
LLQLLDQVLFCQVQSLVEAEAWLGFFRKCDKRMCTENKAVLVETECHIVYDCVDLVYEIRESNWESGIDESIDVCLIQSALHQRLLALSKREHSECRDFQQILHLDS